MNSNFLLAPIISQLITALLLLFSWKRVRLNKVLSLVGSTVTFLLSLILFANVFQEGHIVLHAGNWQPPFGITFVVDTFSAVLVLLTSLVSLTVGMFSIGGISTNRIRYGYFPIYHLLIMGLMGAFLTGDIFNLYVWFEVVIISSFVLLTLGGKKVQMEGAIKYVAMNMLASIFFLTAIGILYGITGSLNMADVATIIPKVENQGMVGVVALMFFVGFGIKSAVFPLYFWLPSSYHTPPSAIAAVFGSLLTKMGIYAMIRIFTLIFPPDDFIRSVFIFIAICTMLTGAFGAINKTSIRKIFSYFIVCHIGYLIAGLGIYTHAAIAGVIFYMMHDIIIKGNLFMISGILYKIRGSTDIRRLGGFYKDYPMLSMLMALVLFSLVGVPPLSGFWPKIQLFQEAFGTQQYGLLAVLLFASFITLFMIARVWMEVFWKDSPKSLELVTDNFSNLTGYKKVFLIMPVVILAAASLFIGLGAEKVYLVVDQIAQDLMNPQAYIKAALQPTN